MRVGPGQHRLSLDYRVCRVAIFPRTYGAREPIVVSVNANGRSSRVNTSESKRELQLRKKLVCTNLFPSFTIISGIFWRFSSNEPSPTHPLLTLGSRDGDEPERRPRWSRFIAPYPWRLTVGGERSSHSPDRGTWSRSVTWTRETGQPTSPAEPSSATTCSV